MKCPYGNHDNTSKVFEGDKFSLCPTCGKSAIITAYQTKDGCKYRLSRTGRISSQDPKRVRTVRLSDAEMQAIESGKLKLTVIDKRITITV